MHGVTNCGCWKPSDGLHEWYSHKFESGFVDSAAFGHMVSFLALIIGRFHSVTRRVSQGNIYRTR